MIKMYKINKYLTGIKSVYLFSSGILHNYRCFHAKVFIHGGF